MTNLPNLERPRANLPNLASDLVGLGRLGTLLFYHLLEPHPDFAAFAERTFRYPRYVFRAILMLLTVALWDYRESPRTCEEFLCSLNTKVPNNGIRRSRDIRVVLYLLIAMDFQGDGLMTADALNVYKRLPERRSWFVGRILRVAKLLGQKSWNKVHCALLSFLDLSRDIAAPFEAGQNVDWTEILGREILRSDDSDASA